MPAQKRASYLTEIADLLELHKEEMAVLLTKEHGKPLTQARDEIDASCGFIRYAAESARRIEEEIAEENGQTDRFIFKMKDDPRITKVGRFIRKTSLDEFPQFFNVLKGDMSLVGPRPALPEEVARYGSLYSTRLLVKPGITGPWQVSGRSDLSQEQSEYLDVSYIENWSIAGDLAILAKQCSWSFVAPDLTKFRSTFRTNRRANQSAPSRSALLLSHVVQMGNVFLCGCDLACLIVGSLVS